MRVFHRKPDVYESGDHPGGFSSTIGFCDIVPHIIFSRKWWDIGSYIIENGSVQSGLECCILDCLSQKRRILYAAGYFEESYS